jgi:hypothetical protein
LGDGLVELTEEIVVETHESSLTNSSNGLVPIKKNVRIGFKRKEIKKLSFTPEIIFRYSVTQCRCARVRTGRKKAKGLKRERDVLYLQYTPTYLDLGKILGLGGKVEATKTDTDGTTGDKDNSMTLGLEFEDGLNDE